MTPPSFALVDLEVHGWLERTRGVRQTDGHLIERLAELHAEFERIHAFLDGNGRTGRLLLLDLVLARLGYPPAIVQKREWSRYLDGLRSADAGRPGPLAELLARAVLDNLYRFVVPTVAGPARLVPLEAWSGPASAMSRCATPRSADGRRRSAVLTADGGVQPRGCRCTSTRDTEYLALAGPGFADAGRSAPPRADRRTTRTHDNPKHKAPGCSWRCGLRQHRRSSGVVFLGLTLLSELPRGGALRRFAPRLPHNDRGVERRYSLLRQGLAAVHLVAPSTTLTRSPVSLKQQTAARR